jgi:hypothetical protein
MTGLRHSENAAGAIIGTVVRLRRAADQYHEQKLDSDKNKSVDNFHKNYYDWFGMVFNNNIAERWFKFN